MSCPSCGHENRSGIAFCEECGLAIGTDAAARSRAEGVIGPTVPGAVSVPMAMSKTDDQFSPGACGHENRPGIAFCETCGAALTKPSTRPDDKLDIPAVGSTRTTGESTRGNSATFTSVCGHANRPGIAFCESCGERILPAAAPARSSRRWQIAAAVILVGGAVGAFMVLRPQDPPTPQELVAQLPDPVGIDDCAGLSAAAGDFIHAAAAVAVEAPSLVADIDQVGSGYSERQAALGCEASVAATVQPTDRPGPGSAPTEIVEYVLRGGEAGYPDNNPGSISIEGSG